MTENDSGQRHDRCALVLYGSETGNSQEAAEELGRVTERLHFATRVTEMDLVKINDLLNYTVVIFAIATTGQGEFPKNARKFWKSLLRKRLPPGCLGHVEFTTFGLGDSSYPKFNWSARKLHKRLEQLGAREVYSRGEADDQHPEGIDGTFLSWSVDLAKHLLSEYPLPDGLSPIPRDILLPPKYTLELLETEALSNSVDSGTLRANTKNTSADTTKQPGCPPAVLNTAAPSTPLSPLSTSRTAIELKTSSPDHSQVIDRMSNMNWIPPLDREPDVIVQLKDSGDGLTAIPDLNLPPPDLIPIKEGIKVTLIENKRITPEKHWQDVRELTFLMADNVDYEPGDTMTIFPKNFPEDVQALIDLMEWNDVADLPVKLVPSAPDFYLAENLMPQVPYLFPLPNTTLRQLLIHNLDITALPTRYFFDIISHCTSDPMHKERLQEFSSPSFIDDFFNYTSRPRRSMLEVLHDFQSVKLPWKWATSIFPVIRGRQFSISSGGLLKTGAGNGQVKVQLLIAIVKYQTVLKKIRQGLCSRYIESLPERTVLNVNVFVGISNFNGLAKYSPEIPIIMIGPGTGVAPCRSMIWHRAALSIQNYNSVGDTLLFFGNRNKDADYFYGDEWELPSLRVKAFTAFSRDQTEKIYVQDIIRREGSLVNQLILDGALIFVCGSAGKMPLEVREAFLDILLEHGEIFEDRQAAEHCVQSWERIGRYVQETW